MRMLLLFDSFKHSASAVQITAYVAEVLQQIIPTGKLASIPLADGGEGSLEAIELTQNYERIFAEVNDPLFRKVKTYYLTSQNVAYIETAKASGIQLLTKRERNCMNTSTYGTGELIKHALNSGIEKIVLFAGGSATNDAGIGAATALGFVFLDENGAELAPIGRNLSRIVEIISPEKTPKIKIEIATDVTNPLFGKTGAAYIYGKQKGANEKEIAALDRGLQHINTLLVAKGFANLQAIEGSGAAGGLPAMLLSYFNVEIIRGTDLIFSLLNIEEAILKADLIITGEGKTDRQTLNGKLVQSVCKLAEKHHKTTWLISGCIENNEEICNRLAISKSFSLIDSEEQAKESIENPEKFILGLSEKLKMALDDLDKF
ncbi:MAG TPA: glycerate kinase [Bacteroidales bacterium]|nr:glycerate kinase [Bacteroidales bacterium]